MSTRVLHRGFRAPAFVCAALAAVWVAAPCGAHKTSNGVSAAEQDDPFVSDDETPTWGAVEVRPRLANGRGVFHRQASDAFVDPDSPTSLDLRYYFRLEDDHPFPVYHYGRDGAVGDQIKFSAAAGANLDGAADWFPLVLGPPADAERLDYHSPGFRREVAMLLDDDDKDPLLAVVRVRRRGASRSVTALLAQRSLTGQERPAGLLPGGRLDTWDGPPGPKLRRAAFGRVIAVLKAVEHRFAVDFYGANLRESADCRVWLPDVDHPWGRPRAIQFMDLPIHRPQAADDAATDLVTTLAVLYRDDEEHQTKIAFDFPLCLSPMLARLRTLGARRGSSSSASSLEQIVGPTVVDELSRRLVAAEY